MGQASFAGHLYSQVFTLASLSRDAQPHSGPCFPELLSTVTWFPKGQRDVFTSILAVEGRMMTLVTSEVPTPFQTLGSGGLETTAVVESCH